MKSVIWSVWGICLDRQQSQIWNLFSKRPFSLYKCLTGSQLPDWGTILTLGERYPFHWLSRLFSTCILITSCTCRLFMFCWSRCVIFLTHYLPVEFISVNRSYKCVDSSDYSEESQKQGCTQGRGVEMFQAWTYLAGVYFLHFNYSSHLPLKMHLHRFRCIFPFFLSPISESPPPP